MKVIPYIFKPLTNTVFNIILKGFPEFEVAPFILISLEFKGLSIHATSKILTCPKTEFRLCLMKLCSSNNPYTTAQHIARITRRFALVEMLPLRLALCLLNKENAIIFHEKMTLNLRKFFYNKKREKKR